MASVPGPERRSEWVATTGERADFFLAPKTQISFTSQDGFSGGQPISHTMTNSVHWQVDHRADVTGWLHRCVSTDHIWFCFETPHIASEVCQWPTDLASCGDRGASPLLLRTFLLWYFPVTMSSSPMWLERLRCGSTLSLNSVRLGEFKSCPP
jgi:hypothetical protein